MSGIITTIFPAVISGIVSLVICLITQNKTQALIEYRLDKVEEKMDKHNNLVERVYKLEQKIEDMQESN